MSRKASPRSRAREILEVSNALASLNTELMRIMVPVHPAHLARIGHVIGELDNLAVAVRQLGLDAEVGTIRFEARDGGPDLPIIAAIDAAQARPVDELVGPGGDWRAVHLAKILGTGNRLLTACREAGFKLAGEAWEELEKGTLSPQFFSHREAKQLEAAIAEVRARAGDPAPFTAEMSPDGARPRGPKPVITLCNSAEETRRRKARGKSAAGKGPGSPVAAAE